MVLAAGDGRIRGGKSSTLFWKRTWLLQRQVAGGRRMRRGGHSIRELGNRGGLIAVRRVLIDKGVYVLGL